MQAYLLEDGTMQIPVAVEGPDGLIGDTAEVIGPDDDRWDEWEPFAVPGPQPS